MSTHLDKYEDVAAAVCGKGRGLTHEDCYRSRKGGYPPCRGYGKCCLFEKSEQQLDFVLHPLETDTFLKACPGSGKTEVVGLMAAYAMRQRAWKHQGIAVLSFTNSAVDVIRERVGRFAGKVAFPHYVGTFDSWLHGYLLNPYGHLITKFIGRDGDHSIRIVEHDSEAAFTKAFTCKTPYVFLRQPKASGGAPTLMRLPLTANRFHFDLREDAFFISRPFVNGRNYIKDEVLYGSAPFQDFCQDKQWLTLEKLRADLTEAKASFWKKGYANHEDVEVICYMLLSGSKALRERLAQRFPFIVVDECQDLSGGQMLLLNTLRDCGSKLHFVGDPHQSIFSFRGVYPEHLLSFVDQSKHVTLQLTKNFRSAQPIVDVCGKLRNQGTVEGLPQEGKEPACVYFGYKGEEMVALASQFEALAITRGCRVEKTAMLARGHSTLRRLTAFDPSLPENLSVRLALAIFLWRQGQVKVADDALKCVGLAVASRCFPNESHDSRNHYKPEAISSNIQWRLFLARVLDGCTEHPGISNLHQNWKVWAGQARKGLGSILTDAWRGGSPLPSHDVGVQTPRNEGSSLVYDTLGLENPATRSNLRITTFHKIKGETLDAALVVSSPTLRSDGGHWLQWLDKNGDEEHRRFAYVASSRPRRLLAWAVPEPDNGQKEILEKLGFVPAC